MKANGNEWIKPTLVTQTEIKILTTQFFIRYFSHLLHLGDLHL